MTPIPARAINRSSARVRRLCSWAFNSPRSPTFGGRELTEEGSKFPKPVATLRCGPIWKTSEIKRFATRYEKPRPGPKPGAALPVKRTRAKKVAPEAVAGNGQANGETKPVKKAAAKKAPAKKIAAKKVAATV